MKITVEKEVVEQALEAMEYSEGAWAVFNPHITALRAALNEASKEVEPVTCSDCGNWNESRASCCSANLGGTCFPVVKGSGKLLPKQKVPAPAVEKQEPVTTARSAFWKVALGNNTKLANLAKAAIAEAETHPAPAVLVSGETSDGYHTFNELYEHRYALFIKLMRSNPSISWRANNHEDGTMFSGGWFIAGMHLPTGDISYHLPSVYWESLDGVGIATSNRGPKWDGHTAEDVVRRLNGWSNYPAPAVPEVKEGWQLVPKEPTAKMLECWKNWGGPDERNYVITKRSELYKAMLAAAPEVKK